MGSKKYYIAALSILIFIGMIIIFNLRSSDHRIEIQFMITNSNDVKCIVKNNMPDSIKETIIQYNDSQYLRIDEQIPPGGVAQGIDGYIISRPKWPCEVRDVKLVMNNFNIIHIENPYVSQALSMDLEKFKYKQQAIADEIATKYKSLIKIIPEETIVSPFNGYTSQGLSNDSDDYFDQFSMSGIVRDVSGTEWVVNAMGSAIQPHSHFVIEATAPAPNRSFVGSSVRWTRFGFTRSDGSAVNVDLRGTGTNAVVPAR